MDCSILAQGLHREDHGLDGERLTAPTVVDSTGRSQLALALATLGRAELAGMGVEGGVERGPLPIAAALPTVARSLARPCQRDYRMSEIARKAGRARLSWQLDPAFD